MTEWSATGERAQSCFGETTTAQQQGLWAGTVPILQAIGLRGRQRGRKLLHVQLRMQRVVTDVEHTGSCPSRVCVRVRPKATSAEVGGLITRV